LLPGKTSLLSWKNIVVVMEKHCCCHGFFGLNSVSFVFEARSSTFFTAFHWKEAVISLASE
jgi:hypothetical protein